VIDPRVSQEVAEALHDGRPVVALETTLVSHGFPDGQGLEAALASEEQVRAAGAVPATIGIADGQVVAGLAKDELARFAAAGPAARKVSARDVGPCLAQRALGATTVGGTLAVCRLLGIAFMGTGGIGGVHRGYAEELDISGDLPQIARTGAVVVSSGVKSILDIRATAELLETLGVPVLGWQTATMPAFYSAETGPPVSATVETAAEAAEVARMHWALNPGCGLLLTRPPGSVLEIEPLIADVVEEVRRSGVSGQAVTPAVLALVAERTGGESIAVNRQLIADNAGLAARVAVAYSGS
jgi:pseudouridine-5'-phosphate glycosidase